VTYNTKHDNFDGSVSPLLPIQGAVIGRYALYSVYSLSACHVLLGDDMNLTVTNFRTVLLF